MAEPSIYRTEHPDVWATVRTYQEERTALSAAIEQLRSDFDMGDRSAMINTGWGTERFAGFALQGNDYHTPPAGWRRAGKAMSRVLVPYLNKTKGDPELIKAWNALPVVQDYRYVWPGMPTHAGLFRSPGCHPDAAEKALYADWGEDGGPNPDRVDLTIWTPVLRSEYFALKEAGEFDAEGDEAAA